MRTTARCKYAILCDARGETLCGTDGVLVIDRRLGQHRRMRRVREYRETFDRHFPRMFAYWTHVMFVNSLHDSSRPQRLEE